MNFCPEESFDFLIFEKFIHLTYRCISCYWVYHSTHKPYLLIISMRDTRLIFFIVFLGGSYFFIFNRKIDISMPVLHNFYPVKWGNFYK